MSQSTDPRLGTTLGGYRIDSLIGRGGMSVVYLAEDLHLGRKVALKFLAPELVLDGKFQERFVRESRLAASLEHPNIVTVYDAREADGQLYLAMRYVAGTDLKRLIASDGPFDAGRTISIIAQAASALDAAHAESLIHRDVKPGNILVTPRRDPAARDRVYLSDFGLTKRATSESGITATGQFVGTLDYAAPEQFEARTLDGRADVYSLGCLLYECLTGEVPYPRENQAALVFAHLQSPAPKVTDKRPELPPAIDDVVAKAMAKRPEDRYGSAGELAEAAAGALGVDSVAPTTPTTPTRPLPVPPRGPSRRTLVIAGTAMVVIVGLIIGLVVASGGSKSPTLPGPGAGSPVDYVARVDPSTKQVTARVSMGEHPIEVAVGEGSAWVLDRDGSVRRIDPVNNEVTVIEGVAPDPRGIAAGSGAVWVGDGLGRDVVKIDPASNKVVETVPMGGLVRDVVAGDDAVWVAAGDHVERIDPSSRDVTVLAGSILTPNGPAPNARSRFAIAFGAGFAWEAFSDYPKMARYGVGASDFRLIDIPVLPRDLIATGTDVWMAACGTPGTVVRMRVDSGEFAASISAGGGVCSNFDTLGYAARIGFGEGGLWVTDAANGTVSRIDETTNQVEAPIRVGDTPTAVAVGLGSVWVAVDGQPAPSPSPSSS
jgi:serine/threonine-protein kinase